MEGILQAFVGFLRVLVRHPGHDIHQSSPSLHLLLQPPSLRHLCPNKAPKVPSPCRDLQSIYPEEVLGSQDVPRIHNQDALGQLREVSLQGPSHHQIIKIPTHVRNSDISVPGLSDSGVGHPEVLDKW